MFNSIKLIKRYCKITLNVFFIKKFYDDEKNYLFDRLFVSNRKFTTEHIKTVTSSRFF